LEFRVVGPGDAALLADVFAEINQTFFRPHPFTPAEAQRIATRSGRDVYALLLIDGRPVGYGMLRGLDEGYPTPSLGIAVRTPDQRKGYGRALMRELHAEAQRRGAERVRLRVHEQNAPARHLYETLGYRYQGTDRGELVMILDLGDEGDPTGTQQPIGRRREAT
jgi:ribosomal protein S18 acetylase RimI-like enzyme